MCSCRITVWTSRWCCGLWGAVPGAGDAAVAGRLDVGAGAEAGRVGGGSPRLGVVRGIAGGRGWGSGSAQKSVWRWMSAALTPIFHVFLVLLPGVPDPFDPTSIGPFLSMRTWVDLRRGGTIWGVSIGWYGRCRVCQMRVPPLLGRGAVVRKGVVAVPGGRPAWFFGRDGDVQRLVEKLKTSQFFAVVGASGSGKSSLTFAGLVPALRAGALPGSETWPVVSCTPGARPLEALTAAVVEVAPQASAPAVLDELRQGDTALSVQMRAAGGRVVLVVDQAEEAFTLCRRRLGSGSSATSCTPRRRVGRAR